MSNMVLGAIVDAGQVEDDVKNHLELWLPTYLAQLAEDRGLPRGTYLRPDGSAVGNWQHTTEFEVQETTALPAVLIINTGLDGVPVREGDGSFRAAWMVGIGVLVSAGGTNANLSSSRLAKRWGAAIRWAMLQYSLDNTAVEGIDWLDEGYDDVPSELQRSLSSARLVFRIEYHSVMNSNSGPGLPTPIADPVNNDYPDWGILPDIDHVHTTVTKEH